MSDTIAPLREDVILYDQSVRVTGFVLPVGNGAVGKTSVARVLYKYQPEIPSYAGMINGLSRTNNLEFEFLTSDIEFGNINYSVLVQMLVPPGQKAREGDGTGRSYEQVIDLYRFYIKSIDVILLTYNISDRETFNDLRYWIKAVGEMCNDATQVILLGTHLDRSNHFREVSKEEVDMAAERIEGYLKKGLPSWRGSCLTIEVSNLTGRNIERLKDLLGKCILWSRGYIGGAEFWESYNYFAANS